MDNRNKIQASSAMNFINGGYNDDLFTTGTSRTDHPSSASNLCNENNINRHENCSESAANSRRYISDGIRQFAVSSERERQQKTPQTRRRNLTNSILIFFGVLAIFAPIAVSTYVLIREKIAVSSCDKKSPGPSITPSTQISQEKYTKLRKLSDDIKDLYKKYHKLKIDLAKSQVQGDSTGSPLRDIRKSRQNGSDRTAYKTSLENLRKRLTSKGSAIQKMCARNIKGLNAKIQSISRKIRDEKSLDKCTFGRENNTEVDLVKNIQKVQINVNKNSIGQVVLVSCCSEYNTSNVSNAILDVSERSAELTYTCYCPTGQICNVCYWQCGDFS